MTSKRRGWTGDLWRRRHHKGVLRSLLIQSLPIRTLKKIDAALRTPAEKSFSIPTLQLGSLAWEPVTWYAPYWPRMKAFALPSYSEGYVRLNLKGRDAHGTVEPADYERVCDELTGMFSSWKCARTGRPIVKKVLRTRGADWQDGSKRPDADLVVNWQPYAVDVIESPEHGVIGPVPYHRTGSHSDRGFVFAQGADIPAGSTLGQGSSIDLTPTLLRLMHAPVPAYMDGHPLIGEKALA